MNANRDALIALLTMVKSGHLRSAKKIAQVQPLVDAFLDAEKAHYEHQQAMHNGQRHAAIWLLQWDAHYDLSESDIVDAMRPEILAWMLGHNAIFVATQPYDAPAFAAKKVTFLGLLQKQGTTLDEFLTMRRCSIERILLAKGYTKSRT